MTELPLALSSRAVMHVFAGELKAAETLVHEVETVTDAIGTSLAPYGAIALAGFRADETALSELTEATTNDAKRTRGGHRADGRPMAERGAEQRSRPVR